jgi:hypothetical protein
MQHNRKPSSYHEGVVCRSDGHARKATAEYPGRALVSGTKRNRIVAEIHRFNKDLGSEQALALVAEFTSG